MEEAERVELEEFISQLEDFKGRHTELISVYVPAGTNLVAVSKQLEQEKGTASNIKDKSTRNNVIDSLERLTRHMKLFKETPKNGLALFSGNTSKTEGQPKIEIWSIEPPLPLKTKLYRCDQEFLLEPLKEMLEASDVYGLVVVDRKEATLGVLEGKNIRVLRKMTSGVSGKMKVGGQSAHRFERAREEVVKEFYRRVSEFMKDVFYNMPKLKGLLIGGPGMTKDIFLEKSQLITALRDKILAVKSVGYSDESGLKELVEGCYDVLAKEEITKEKEILQRFLSGLASGTKKVVFGIDKVKKAIELGAVEELLISRALDKAIALDLKKRAVAINASIRIISTETNEGLEFKNISGVGAFLRFPLD